MKGVTFEIVRNPNAEPKLIGYARVSTEEQSLDMQVKALERAGVNRDDIYVEKVSGAASKRYKLDEAIADLREGDTFVVWKLDRVGRSLIDLLNRMKTIDKAGAKFQSITEAIDTKTIGGRLLLNVLGAIAEFERDLIQERTKAGVKRAKEKGIRFGQPEKLTDAQKKTAAKLRKQGVSVREIAKQFSVSAQTIYAHTRHSALLKK